MKISTADGPQKQIFSSSIQQLKLLCLQNGLTGPKFENSGTQVTCVAGKYSASAASYSAAAGKLIKMIGEGGKKNNK